MYRTVQKYIFTKDEIRRIFKAVDSLEPCASVPNRHLVMPILLIGKAFRGFLWDAGIPYLGKDRGPSVHDLRHTFVCHRLNQWAADGADLNAVLPVLSKYLGHTSVSATGWYLRLTAEAYPDVIQAMEHFSADVFPNVWEVNNVE